MMLSRIYPTSPLWQANDPLDGMKKKLAEEEEEEKFSSTPVVITPVASKKRSIHDRLREIVGPMITEEQLIQKFTFGRILGSGATSKVYAAKDTSTNEEVAIKVFDKAAMIEVRRSMVAHGEYVQEKAVDRVRRRLLKVISELEISKTLNHPNIIRYLGAYETSHRICIVHEYVDGCDLLEYLLTCGKMNEEQAAIVFQQLFSALSYCHERNIYHRDLKLENVLLTRNFQVKLIDFGLSEVKLPGELLRTICGTPLYCSPEVLFLHASNAKGTKGFQGAPADVWSIGVLIFALLTGCAPFDDSNFVKLRGEVYRNTISYPEHLSDQVKGLLKAILIFDATLRPTVDDLLTYGWIQNACSTYVIQSSSTQVIPLKNSCVTEKVETPTCSPTKLSSIVQSASPVSTLWTTKQNPCLRSFSSCLSENDTETTSSTTTSFEEDLEKKTEAKPEEEKNTTHFKSFELEKELAKEIY